MQPSAFRPVSKQVAAVRTSSQRYRLLAPGRARPFPRFRPPPEPLASSPSPRCAPACGLRLLAAARARRPPVHRHAARRATPIAAAGYAPGARSGSALACECVTGVAPAIIEEGYIWTLPRSDLSAVRTRWHMLQGKWSIATTTSLYVSIPSNQRLDSDTCWRNHHDGAS